MKRKNLSLKNYVSTAVVLGSLLVGCSSPPRLVESPCVLDPSEEVAYCSPPNGQTFELKMELMSGYSCFSLSDTEVLITFIKRHSKNLTTNQRVKLLHEMERLAYSQSRVNAIR